MKTIIKKDLNGREYIIYNECSCLFAEGVHDKTCYKRNYIITDIFHNTYIDLSICNEHLRVLLNKYKFENNADFILNKNDKNKYYLGKILENIFSKYVKIYSKSMTSRSLSNDFLNNEANIVICNRPFISMYVPIKDLIISCIDNPVGSFKKNSMSLDILIEEFKKYISNMKFKKYQNRYNKANVKLKKFESCRDVENKELYMMEFVNELFKLKINY